jgi:methionyl-tRNA formyltransferase
MKTIFVGNRFRVLESVLQSDYEPLSIFAVKDSYLERELIARDIGYTRIESKPGLVAVLQDMDYDLLISNGCPYLLPISSLESGNRKFINIHPALLPEQRGPYAVNGALLYQHGAGATCHMMDDGVDTGPIISRVEIPYSPDLDLGMLYQLSFTAEVDAFTRAEARDFRPSGSFPPASVDSINFLRPDRTPELDLTAGLEDIFQLVRAFGIASQGVSIRFGGELFRVFDAEIVTNAYLLSKAADYQQNEVAYVYDNTLVLRKGDGFIKLKGVEGAAGRIPPGVLLE